MKKEDELLEEARIKTEEEEEGRKREEAARLAFDPEARYSMLDELLMKIQLFSKFLLEKMDQITDITLGNCSGLEDSWKYKIYFEDDRMLHAEHRGMTDIAGGNLQQLVGLQNLLFPSCSKVQEFPDYQIQVLLRQQVCV
ncbi:hypothetical protein ACP70R_024914 [Stipagrostis hirtigluma subsp. patula]